MNPDGRTGSAIFATTHWSAVLRINAHRRSQGLPAIDSPVVSFGDEVVTGQVVRKSTLPGGPTVANLPPVVDNSKLSSFPPIRDQGYHSSCVSFAATYYMATHMLGRARGWNNRNEDNNIAGWGFLTIQDDPSTAADSEWEPATACYHCSTTESRGPAGGHDHVECRRVRHAAPFVSVAIERPGADG